MNINRRTFCGSLAATALLPALGANAQSKDKITLAFGHQAIGVGEELWMYAVPQQLGYFEEENLQVDPQFTAGSAMTVQLVSGGRADMGQGNPSTLLNAMQKGAAVRMVYAWNARFASALAVAANSDIKAPKDLAGKLVGVSSLASGRMPEAISMVKAAGLMPDKDVRFVAVGTGAQASTALSSGQVQALYLWNAAYAAIEAQGFKLKLIKEIFPGYEKLLDSVQFATEDLITNHPASIVGFGRAAAKGMIWTITNPEAALELFYRTFPDAAARTKEARAADLTILKAIMPDADFRKLSNPKFGYLIPENVEFTLKFNVNSQQVAGGLDPSKTYTNQFIDDINAFDFAAVEKAARDYKL